MSATPEHKKSLKAGMALFGDIDGTRHIIAPYTEGRFGTNLKYYGLGKGKIDAGEDAFEAAMRECSEETGIDVGKLLGNEAMAQLRRGEPVENIESGYPGVRIKRVIPNALEYTYIGRGGSPHDFALFAIELEGIEHLWGELKNQRNRGHYLGDPQEVYHPIRTELASEEGRRNYPSMQQCLDWMRTMHMPAAPWAKDRAGEPLPRINGEGDHWFADLEAAYMEKIGRPGGHIKNVAEWQSFQKNLVGENYQLLSKHAEQIRDALVELGVITGKDDAVIKFDTKDSPLLFYQEGADLLTAENYLKSVMDAGLQRGDFNLAFCGNVPAMTAKDAPRMERISNAQLAGVVWAAGDQAIEAVADGYLKKPAKTDGTNAWLGGDMYDDSIRHDLRGVMANMHTKEVPITQVLQAQSRGAVQSPPIERQA